MNSDQTLIPYFPNDVALNILARIPRTHHPILSLVSKPFKSLLSSPLFYTSRSLLNTSQPSLYLSLRIPSLPTLQWFSLYKTPTKCHLVPLPPTPTPLVGSTFVSLGHTIYVIGGSVNDVASSHVWALDCRFHTWEERESMRVSREFAAAGVVDGRIYVIGGCLVDTWRKSRYWAEVYDPKRRRWEGVESGGMELREKWMHGSVVVDSKVYAMADRNGVVYDVNKGEWGCVECELDLGWRGRACVVDEIIYSYDYLGKIRGFDCRIGGWKEVRGVEKELPRFLCGATMANVDGKLVVLWEEKGKGRKEIGKEVEIWCAEIELERKREDGELWGKVRWVELIHKVPTGSSIVHCLEVIV